MVGNFLKVAVSCVKLRVRTLQSLQVADSHSSESMPMKVSKTLFLMALLFCLCGLETPTHAWQKSGSEQEPVEETGNSKSDSGQTIDIDSLKPELEKGWVSYFASKKELDAAKKKSRVQIIAISSNEKKINESIEKLEANLRTLNEKVGPVGRRYNDLLELYRSRNCHLFDQLTTEYSPIFADAKAKILEAQTQIQDAKDEIAKFKTDVDEILEYAKRKARGSSSIRRSLWRGRVFSTEKLLDDLKPIEDDVTAKAKMLVEIDEKVVSAETAISSIGSDKEELDPLISEAREQTEAILKQIAVAREELKKAESVKGLLRKSKMSMVESLRESEAKLEKVRSTLMERERDLALIKLHALIKKQAESHQENNHK